MTNMTCEGDYNYLDHEIGSADFANLTPNETISEAAALSSISPSSSSVVRFSTDSETPLHRSGPGTALYKSVIEDERRLVSEKRIQEAKEASSKILHSAELQQKLLKLAPPCSRAEIQDGDEDEARSLIADCRNSRLYKAVKKGNDSLCDLSAPSWSRFLPRRLKRKIRRGPVRNFRMSSKASSASSASKSSGKRSTSTTANPSTRDTSFCSAATTTALRQRAISGPLELDPQWCREQRYFRQERGSFHSNKPLFREPIYGQSEESLLMSCEIFHVISTSCTQPNSIYKFDTSDGSLVHRLSTSISPLSKKTYERKCSADRPERIIEIQEVDELGRKKVRLTWGTQIDKVIPHFRVDDRSGEIVADPVATVLEDSAAQRPVTIAAVLGGKRHKMTKAIQAGKKKLANLVKGNGCREHDRAEPSCRLPSPDPVDGLGINWSRPPSDSRG